MFCFIIPLIHSTVLGGCHFHHPRVADAKLWLREWKGIIARTRKRWSWDCDAHSSDSSFSPTSRHQAFHQTFDSSGPRSRASTLPRYSPDLESLWYADRTLDTPVCQAWFLAPSVSYWMAGMALRVSRGNSWTWSLMGILPTGAWTGRTCGLAQPQALGLSNNCR